MAPSSTILVTAPYPDAQLRPLADVGPVAYHPWTELGRARTDAELAELAARTGARVVIVELDEVGAGTLAVPGLEVVGCCRSGVVNVDLDRARGHGVTVLRAPGRNAQAVAEWCLAAMIGVLRQLYPAEEFLRAGRWLPEAAGDDRPYLRFRGHELSGRTVALLGFGEVPRRLHPVLTALGCPVLAHDPFAKDLPNGVESVGLEEAFARAGVLSIHLPVTPSTTGLVTAELLDLLPSHAIVVNSARSKVLDTGAVLERVRSGRLAGFATDVFDVEPPTAAALAAHRHPRVLITPHIAGATSDVPRHHAEIMNAALLGHLAGSPIPGTEVA